MRLIHNWRAVLKRAWSVRFLSLVLMLEAAQVALQFLAGGAPSLALAALAFVVSIAAVASRLIYQASVSGGDA